MKKLTLSIFLLIASSGATAEQMPNYPHFNAYLEETMVIASRYATLSPEQVYTIESELLDATANLPISVETAFWHLDNIHHTLNTSCK